mmetsp:Transcript_15114/g.59167  ORF Transcript_15114/g.59167 Transcript_15114/m.59167 type:complete len:1081 (-) Transcript_15114:30-3272(-)
MPTRRRRSRSSSRPSKAEVEAPALDGVRKMMFSAWSTRLPCVEWAKLAQAALRDEGQDDVTAASLCQFFYEEMVRGRLCSKILLAYLHHALACRLVPPEQFIGLFVERTLAAGVADLSPPLLFVFLELLDKFWASAVFDKEGTGVESIMTTASFLTGHVLRTALLYQGTAEGHTAKTVQAHTKNALFALRVLTAYFQQDHTAALAALAKTLAPEAWEMFFAECGQVHGVLFGLLAEQHQHQQGQAMDVDLLQVGEGIAQLAVSVLSKFAFAELMLEQWRPFCDALDCVVDLHNAVNDPRPGAFPAVAFMRQAAERVNAAPQWSLLDFTLQLEVVSVTLVSPEESFARLRTARDFYRHETDADFCSLLLAACMKAEWMALTSREESQWGMYRSLLLCKVPAFLEDLLRAPSQAPFYSLSAASDATPVEASLVHLSRFPSLVQRIVDRATYEKFRYLVPEARYEMFFALVRVLHRRGLVRLEYLRTHIPFLAEMPAEEPPSAEVDLLLSTPNASASTPQELEQLAAFVHSAIPNALQAEGEAQLKGALACLMNTLRHAHAIQDSTAAVILGILDHEGAVSDAQLKAVSLLCAVQSSDRFHRLINVLCLHGLGPSFVARLLYFIERLGSVTSIAGVPARDLFSPVFITFVHVAEKFSVKSNVRNQRLVARLFAKYPKGAYWFQQLLQTFDVSMPLGEDEQAIFDAAFGAATVNHLELERLLLLLTPLRVLEIMPRVVVAGVQKETNPEVLSTRAVSICQVYHCACLRVFSVLGQEQFLKHLPLPAQADSHLTFQFSVLAALLKVPQQQTADEVTAALKLIIMDRYVAKKQARTQETSSNSNTFVAEVVGQNAYTDFLVNSRFDVNCIFQSLLSGSTTLRQSRAHQLGEIAGKLSQRAFVELVLKESRVLCSAHTVGHGAVTTIQAAELGGSLVGMHGQSHVAELILYCLPNTVPTVTSVPVAQSTAHFVWAACLISSFFAVQDMSPADSSKTKRARAFLWVFLAELLERLVVAPGAILSLPITLLALASNHPSALEGAPLYRIAASLSRLGFRRLAMALLDPANPSFREDYLRICCVALEDSL